MKLKIGLFEFLLIQLVIYAVIWLLDDYIGFFITVAFPIVIGAILLVSLIVEWIEPSKVPKAYFKYMIAAVIAPLIVFAFFFTINQGVFEWMTE